MLPSPYRGCTVAIKTLTLLSLMLGKNLIWVDSKSVAGIFIKSSLLQYFARMPRHSKEMMIMMISIDRVFSLLTIKNRSDASGKIRPSGTPQGDPPVLALISSYTLCNRTHIQKLNIGDLHGLASCTPSNGMTVSIQHAHKHSPPSG